MVIAYHYTSKRAFEAMQRNGGLAPTCPLVHRSIIGLPEKVYVCAVYALLKPKPEEWISNSDFPHIWGLLNEHLSFNRIGSNKVLLKFDINKNDDAYVFDRSHLERYRELIEKNKFSLESHIEAARQFFDSRIPVFDYKGGYSLPEVAIFNTIELDRLSLEKIHYPFWRKLFDKISTPIV